MDRGGLMDRVKESFTGNHHPNSKHIAHPHRHFDVHNLYHRYPHSSLPMVIHQQHCLLSQALPMLDKIHRRFNILERAISRNDNCLVLDVVFSFEQLSCILAK